jgi:hypothetical protein
VSLLREVVTLLDTQRIPHALIGAAAMALHGVSRATADVDLLTVDARVLAAELWKPVGGGGVSVRLLRGDVDDPLAGSVRLTRAGDRVVDVVVGRHGWQREIVDAAEPISIGEVSVRIARPAGLVLLKLYAGGPKDAWDVRWLLESHEQADAIRAEVESALPKLPPECRVLWNRVRSGH